MSNRFRLLVAATVIALVAGACHEDPDPGGGPDVFAVNAELGRGINLGAALEAGAGENWGLSLADWNFAVIADAGFDHVRLPVKFSDYAADAAPYTIATRPDPRLDNPNYDNIWEAVDWAIAQAEANDLDIIVDVHHYEEIHEDPEGERDRFVAIWTQIGLRYTHAGDHVLFELLNEPSGLLTAQPAVWNSLIVDALEAIRVTNPTRPVLVGPAGLNSIDRLADLELPSDPYLITSVHFYEPFGFTHQGAPWTANPPPTPTNWDPAVFGIAAGWNNHSWGTTVTGTSSGVVAEFSGPWSGLKFAHGSTVDPISITMTVSGVAPLVMVCEDDDPNTTGGATDPEVASFTTASASSTYTFDLTGCPANTQGIFLMNTGAAEPLAFTHIEVCSNDGCEPVISSAAEAIDAQMARAAAWGAANNRPMHLGEFGAYDGNGLAPLPDRAAWLEAVQDAARSNGLSTSAWTFVGAMGVYDPVASQWIQPLLDALR